MFTNIHASTLYDDLYERRYETFSNTCTKTFTNATPGQRSRIVHKRADLAKH